MLSIAGVVTCEGLDSVSVWVVVLLLRRFGSSNFAGTERGKNARGAQDETTKSKAVLKSVQFHRLHRQQSPNKNLTEPILTFITNM